MAAEKSIAEKLKLQRYEKVAVLHMPEGIDYVPELSGYDTELTGEAYDLIFGFVVDMPSLKDLVEKVVEKDLLNKNGYLYIAYAKKGNKAYPTYVHRDEILPGLGAEEDGYVGDSDVKFSRMVGLDDVFTVVGLKKEPRRKTKKTPPASQCVADYIDNIPDVEHDLQDRPDLLEFYRSLTPGYRRDWARYIYSAKQEATRAKRREEMKKIMSLGYKSRDLYLQHRSAASEET